MLSCEPILLQYVQKGSSHVMVHTIVVGFTMIVPVVMSV